MHPALIRTLNNRWILLGLMFTIISLGACLGWLHSKPGATLGWFTSQYFFSYQELGFVSRGLVATVLHPFPFLLSKPGLLSITATILIVFVVIWWNLLGRCTRHLEESSRAAIVLMFLLAPSTLLHVGADYGRFDPLNLVLAIVAARFLQKSHDALAALVTTTAVLIHEGFMVLELPLLCAYVLSLERGTHIGKQIGRLVRFVLFPSAAAIAILAWGKYEPGIDTLMARFEGNALYRAASLDGDVSRDALLVIVRSFKENMDFNSTCFQMTPWFHFVLIGAWFWVVALFYDRIFRRNSLSRDWLYFSAYSPLLMSIVACDYFRWVALASINMFIVLLLKIESRGQYNEPIVIPWNSMAKIITVSCFLGPISDTTSFPCLLRLLKPIMQWLTL